MQQEALRAMEISSKGAFVVNPEIRQFFIRPPDLVKVSRCKRFLRWLRRVFVGGWTLLGRGVAWLWTLLKRGVAWLRDPETYKIHKLV